MAISKSLLASAAGAVKSVWEVLRIHWYLGFTAFGGPPVHFKIFHDKFVDSLGWIDEQMYQELFSVTQALSGPGSTKLLYCINLIHGGLFSAVLSFFVWSLPGALGMYGLALGVANIGQPMPRAAYALLSGLNAATVGIIALAAVELAQKAITDPLTRIVVFMSAAAGMLYNALWYFPLLMFLSGCATVIFDYRWLHGPVGAVVSIVNRGKRRWQQEEEGSELRDARANEAGTEPTAESRTPRSRDEGESRRRRDDNAQHSATATTTSINNDSASADSEPRIIPPSHRLALSWRAGTAIIAAFLASFVVVMALRGALRDPQPLLFRLFANMYLAGTIIFGGGPVVVPLLREYIVAEGWVTPRDFLIGLAVVQAFPGPNFNFAVYLGALTARGGGGGAAAIAAGAALGFVGIFAPGLILAHGTIGVWGALRSRRWVRSGLRGVNAGAVGLIYTAVYRLWQSGFLDETSQAGKGLGEDAWWVVVAATSYVGGRWFGVNPALAIAIGVVMGLVRYGVTSSRS